MRYFYLLLLFLPVLAFGQITTSIDFDDDTKWTAGSTILNSYGNGHTYTDGVFTAVGNASLRETAGTQDGFPRTFGTYAWRLRDAAGSSLVMNIASGGVSDFSVNIRRWDGSPDPNYNLEYSIDGGTTWTSVATISNATLGNSSEYVTFNGTINSHLPNIQIRLERNSGERIMVDDFEWIDFPAPLLPGCTNETTDIDEIGIFTQTLPVGGTGVIGAQSFQNTINSVSLEIQHDEAADLTIQLTSPSGTTVMLAENRGGVDGLDSSSWLVFADDAADEVVDWAGGAPAVSYIAEAGLLNDLFAGENVAGDWTLTITDGGGLLATGTLTNFCIDVVNNDVVGDIPTISCPANIVVEADPGMCSVEVNFGPASALDAEDGPLPVTQTEGPASGSIFPVGVTTITYEATDSDGNTVECSFTITVEDNEDPVAVAQDITVVLDAAGMASITADDIDNGSTDNCDIDTIEIDITSFDCSDVGDNEVTLTVTDLSGNVSTATATVTVVDDIAPIIQCVGAMNNTIVAWNFESETVAPSQGAGVISLIGGIVESSPAFPQGSGGAGTFSYSSTGYPAQGTDSGTAGFLFELSTLGYEDVTVSFERRGSNTASAWEQYEFSTDGGATWTVVGNNDGATENGWPGVITVSLPAEANDAADLSFRIVSIFEPSTSEYAPIGATSNYGTGGTWRVDNVMFIGEPTTVSSFDVYLDADGMVVIDPADLILNVDEACGYTISAGGSTSGPSDANCDLIASTPNPALGVNTWTRPFADGTCCTGLGPMSYYVYGPFTVDTAGSYTINAQYDAWDGYLFLYQDSFDPENQTENYVAGNDDFGGVGASQIISNLSIDTDYFVVVTAFSTGFGDFELTITGPGEVTCGDGGSSEDGIVLTCENLGLNEIEVTVTDASGNSSTCIAVVNVIDNIAPVLVLQDIELSVGENGTVVLDPMDLVDEDNTIEACGFEIITADITNFSCLDIGQTVEVTVFVQDFGGNIASGSAMVTIVDLIAPVIECAEDMSVQPEANGVYTLEDFIEMEMVSATDNCSEEVTLTQTPAPGTPLGVGTYDITITAEDEYGNVSTCVFELVVEPLTGIDDNTLANGLVLYPNPANHNVTLVNNTMISLRELVIYDVAGKVVNRVDLSQMQSEQTLDVSHLSSGVYMVRVQGETATAVKRLIKK